MNRRKRWIKLKVGDVWTSFGLTIIIIGYDRKYVYGFSKDGYPTINYIKGFVHLCWLNYYTKSK